MNIVERIAELFRADDHPQAYAEHLRSELTKILDEEFGRTQRECSRLRATMVMLVESLESSGCGCLKQGDRDCVLCILQDALKE